jgi:hypothetical protein
VVLSFSYLIHIPNVSVSMPSLDAVILNNHCRDFCRFLRTNSEPVHDTGSSHPFAYFFISWSFFRSMFKRLHCFRITFEWKQVMISHSCKRINSPACEKIESKRKETNAGYKINVTLYGDQVFLHLETCVTVRFKLVVPSEWRNQYQRCYDGYFFYLCVTVHHHCR